MDKISIPSPNPDAEAGPDERLLPEEGQQTLHQKKPSRRRKTGIILLQIIVLAFAFITGSTAGYKWRGDLDHLCTGHVSQYCVCNLPRIQTLSKILIPPAPVIKDVDITYTVQRFNGSLLKENIFRQDASPEVDAAWESLGINCNLSLFPQMQNAPR